MKNLFSSDSQKFSSMKETLYGMHQIKIMLTFGTFFRNAFAVQVAPQIGRFLPQITRLLPRIGRFLLKKRKPCSKERWVHTHISFQNVAQLCLQILWSCVCVFWSCICVFQAVFLTEKQNSNRKVSTNACHF